jgi:hypothetical protein
MPVARAGLLCTVAGGILILAFRDPFLVLAARGVEGLGAGLFVASGMSWVNTRPGHERISGDFMASLNLGLLTGLLGSGWLADLLRNERAGILVFTVLSALPALLVFPVGESAPGPVPDGNRKGIGGHFWLYLSAVILVGVTGGVTAIYPEFSGEPASSLGVIIATMHLATVVAVMTASRLSLPAVPTIRASAILLSGAVLLLPFSPAGFALIGAIVGFVMIAQMAYLAGTGLPQGAVMGSYNAASYAGMTLLPFLAGVIAEDAGFLPAFAAIAILALSTAGTIGWCRCGGGGSPTGP